jgi:UDP-N-acetylmuramoyl-L-alanyl-D-glutamate--2,6-diaminopimelate ligase
MEVSSHAIRQRRTGDTVFAGGGFTNISEDHLDYHKTMEEYFRVKRSFAEQIARENPSSRPAPFAVCVDGEGGARMYEACRAIPGLDVMPVSARPGAFDFSGLQLVGDYNKSNAALAAALALVAGVPYDAVQRTIPELRPRWGRLEPVKNPAISAKAYVDFAHTPDGLEKVLSAARGFTPQGGRLWVVFGAGGDRDPMKRPLMGEACARLADCLVVTSDNPRSEDPGRIIDAIVEGVERVSARPSLVRVEPDRREAILFALANAGVSDVVIIAGKGHETTQEIAGVKHPFDDREVVRSFTRRFADGG